MNLYKIATYAAIGAASASLALVLSNCGPLPEPTPTPTAQGKTVLERTLIDKFGVSDYRKGVFGGTASVAVGDMDGDGDLDIIIANASGEVIILENTMLQKRK